MPRRRSTRTPTPRFNLDRGYIFLIFRYSGGRLKMSTAEQCDPKQWDKSRQRIKAKGVAGDRSNRQLARYEATVLAVYEETNRAEGIKPAKFAELIDRKLGNLPPEPDNDGPTLIQFIRQYNQRKESDPSIKAGTTKNLHTYEKNLKDFFAWIGRTPDWQHFDELLFEEYKRWGFNEKGWSINYVAKQMQVWRQWLRAARNLYPHDPSVFTIRKTATNKPVLYEDEIYRLYEHPFTGTMERVRDLFIMGTFSLQRISDWKRITPSRIQVVMNQKMINLWQAKTNTPVAVALHPLLEELLEKYQYGLPMEIGPNFDQVFNRQLKDMAKEAGFIERVPWITSTGGKVRETLVPRYETISSHVCRRSGATILTLPPWNVPKTVVQLILGHSDVKMTEAYINVGNRLSAQALAETYAAYKRK